jgi:Asp-tRNA(Asn)/Glu-tRNA(Gln) amidotransferase A subunit family amidase
MSCFSLRFASVIPFYGSTTSHPLRIKLSFHWGYAATTPTEVIEKVIAGIHRLQPDYAPFSADPLWDEMRAEAAAATERYASYGTGPLSIWDGVPVAFKDMIPIKGYVVGDGSAYRAHDPAAAKDDILVLRFRELGAVILPPTAMTEGGTTPLGYSVHNKGPFNPYNKNHYSGGSSGGSAVAVALGLTPVAIGFDGGGSIRTPASLSGIVGLATGYGRFPFSSQYTSTMIKAGVYPSTFCNIWFLGGLYRILASFRTNFNAHKLRSTSSHSRRRCTCFCRDGSK